MKRIAKWLIGIEQEASVFYRAASEKFKEDEGLSTFARRLAEEEEGHRELMKVAAEHLQVRHRVSPLTMEEAAKEKIEACLTENQRRLAENSLTVADFCSVVVELEYSEWNHIFLYVMNAAKEIDKGFSAAAANIQQHLKGIEEFFASRPECREQLGAIRRLPPVWQGRILIVEDDGLVSEFLRVALEELGIVDVAWNGEEGLKKMRDIHYDAVVCDVVMPKMDGIEFFRRAIAEEPQARERFIFLTGFAADKRLSFLKENNLAFIVKPAPIGKIRQGVRDIMMKSAGTPNPGIL
jgi:CheY-like chemotaxis protein/rubrerythrin